MQASRPTYRHKRVVFLLALVPVFGFTAPAAGQTEQPAKPVEEAGLPAALSGFHDEGVFYLFKDESRIITMTYKWEADGSFEGKSVISMAGQTVESTLKIVPEKDGR